MNILKSIFVIVLFTLLKTNVSGQGVLTPVPYFGSNPGNLSMYSYVPSGISGSVPLVVAMHGCSQTASVFSLQSGWNKLADRHKFIMVYPEQIIANNSSRCFNWFDASDQSKNTGEALSIKQMVDYMKLNYPVDTTKIFVTGLSAGGSMTSVMLATYPEIFNKGAIMAGIPYKASSSASTATLAMGGYIVKTPSQWGALVRNENPVYSGSFPHVALFHGTADLTVNAVNAGELIDQWTDVNNADQTADITNSSFQGNTSVEQTIYMDSLNNPVVYYYKITGMGHGISIDTGACPDQGGSTGTYTIEKNFHSTYWAAEFFEILTLASQTITLCAGESVTIGNHTYNATNTYTDTLIGANGCDSILTTNLIVYTANPLFLNINSNDTLCNLEGAFVLSGGNPANGFYSGSGVSAGNFYPSMASIGWNIIMYTVIDGNNCSKTVYDSLYVNSCISTSLSDKIAISKNIILYPNPANDEITISAKGVGQFDLNLYNSIGALIFNKQFNTNVAAIDIHSLQPGLYLMMMKTKEGVITQKIIKN